LLLSAALAAAPPLQSAAAPIGSPLPYEAPAKHVGVAACASSVCHGSVTGTSGHNVRLDEFVTWSHQDKHSQAYTTLSGEKGRAIAAKLGIADARTEKSCLDCHSDNVPVAQRASGFTLADGVGCEACHGGAGPWLGSHSSRDATYDQDIARGMYPTARLRERAVLCISCHYGSEDKFATHRLMGAGHPRLAFELDTFLALQPPHYQVDADYQKRKPTYPRPKVWAYGQLMLAGRQLELLQGPLVRQASFLPEFALLDCHTCHENPLHRLDWARGSFTHFTQPGSVAFPKAYLEMAAIIARRVDASAATEIVARGQALERAAGEDRERIVEAAAELARVVSRTREAALVHQWTRADEMQMLVEVAQRGVDGEYRDYVSAEQGVMAIDLLMIDIGIADQYRTTLDELYRTVRNDDSYDAVHLRETLETLAQALEGNRSHER
jgi:hypothetical protein